MQKFQQLIIKQNQIEQNYLTQQMALVFQFLFTLIEIFISLEIMEKQNHQALQFEMLYYFSLPTLAIFLGNLHPIFQGLSLAFSFSFIIAFIFACEVKSARNYIQVFWHIYPNLLSLMIIHNSGYLILEDNMNFVLSLLNIILAITISQFVCLYSFHQNNSQILLRSYIQRSTIPLLYSMLAFLAGLVLRNSSIVYIFLGAQLVFDLLWGPFYYIRPHMQFNKLSTTKLSVLFSMLRFPIVGFLIYYQGNQIFYFSFFITPIIIKLHLILWDNRFIQLIYKRNMYFQHICLDKYRENVVIAENYLAYFFEIITYKKPLNRVLMLSLFCNHMNMCTNVKCFCQNKQFYENVSISTTLAVDLVTIKQQINYQIGENEILLCYKQLLLLFFDNFIKNQRYTSLQETLILELSLFEVNQFKSRLFQSKVRFQHIKIHYPGYHPLFIQRIGTQQLITKSLQQFIGDSSLTFNVQIALKYFKLLDEINDSMDMISKVKLAILDLIKMNYQNSIPYLLHTQVAKYIKKCNKIEQLIQELTFLNGTAEEVRDLQNDFYSLIKIDYKKRNIHRKFSIPFINLNPTAFVICNYENGLKILEYSSNFIGMINLNSQIRGLEIETIVPAPLQNYHRLAVASMINTGQTKLVNKGQYNLIVKSEKYILEVDALLRYDYRDQNSLKFIGFMQQRDKDSMLILASEKGRIDSYSRSAGILLNLNQLDLSILNYFYLSPNLLLQKNEFEFDGFLLLPKKNVKKDILSHYRHFISYPDECFVFLVNGEHKTQTYTAAQVHYLKINSFYFLKESDFKVVALDLMIRQIMIQKKVNKSQYSLPPESFRKIETFRKTLKITTQQQTYSLEEERYNLEIEDDSERNIQQLKSGKVIVIQDFLPSLDSIRTQQDKLLITMDQYKDLSYPILGKEFDQQQKAETLDFGSKSEQDTLSKQYRNTHQMIEIELEASEDQNIEEQMQIILKNVKQNRTRKELLEMKNQRKNGNIKASTWHGGSYQTSQKQLIISMVNQFISTKLHTLSYIKSTSPLLILINLAFVIGFILNSISELAGIQMDSNNQTYPLILLQDVNLVLIGIQLGDWDQDQAELAQYYIKTGSGQYQNMSIHVNDIENDYHLFLQELDEETIEVQEDGLPVIYKAKYFLKNYLISALRTTEELSQISLWDVQAEFLFNNYPLLAQKFWNLKNQTTNDVVQRMGVLNWASQLLLILSTVCNIAIVVFYVSLLIKIFIWRDKLFSTFFLFSNIQQTISLLAEKINFEKDIEMKEQKYNDEEKNQKLKQFWVSGAVVVTLLLLILSLGFYIPLFLYIDSVNTQSLQVNQLQTEVTLMQLKESTLLFWYFINQTEIKYNVTLIHDTSILSQVIQDCTPSETFVLYDLPFDSKYSYFPEIQQYSTTLLCNCSLIDGQLANGYNGFYQYVIQHLSDAVKLIDIMNAYQYVVEYQINTKQIYDDYMQLRLSNTQYNLQEILVISVIALFLVESSLLAVVFFQLKKIVEVAKDVLYLFPPTLLATNKYTLQILLQYGVQ